MRTGFVGVASSSASGPGAPGAPQFASAPVTEVREITFSWNAPVSDGGSTITSYEVEYSTDSGSTWLSAGTTSPPTTSKTISSLADGSYTFRVRALNGIGYGPYATTASPTVISISTVTGGTLTSDSTHYYRTFTSNGTLTVSGSTLNVEYVVVGGGGAGERTSYVVSANPAVYWGRGGAGSAVLTGSTSLSGSYAITVGQGGIGGEEYDTSTTQNGGTSSIQGVATQTGGLAARLGGSNGVYSQGSDTAEFERSRSTMCGGGAGAGGNGGNASAYQAGAGGIGVTIWGGTYGGGGAGGGAGTPPAASRALGGSGIGGDGIFSNRATSTITYPTAGAANTGSGGGGGEGSGTPNYNALNGGSGIVIVRYSKFDVE